jgi:hypothetical protein
VLARRVNAVSEAGQLKLVSEVVSEAKLVNL